MTQDPSRISSIGTAPATIAARGVSPVMPSLFSYAPTLLLLIAIAIDSKQSADTDLWGHVLFGQVMLGTGHLIRTNIYAYSAPGRPWIDHEWLTEVVMALLYNAIGIAGLQVLKLLCASAIVILLAAGLAETGASIAPQFIALAAVAIALTQQMQFRPQLFDYVFLAALIAMLARECHGRRAPLWLAVPMLALWANLHGGFFVGLAALGVYSAACAVEGLMSGARLGRALRPAVVTAAAALATLCNPWGGGEWTAVARSLRNPYTIGRISEFKPLLRTLDALHRAGMSIFPLLTMLLMLAMLIAACLLAPRREDDGLLAVAALMVAAAFAAVRNTALAALAMAVPLAYHVDLAAARLRSRTISPAGAHAASARAPAAMPLALQAVVALAALFLAIRAGVLSGRLSTAGSMPMGAVDFMTAHGLSGNVLGDYSWGGYLIWHAPPGSKVFIDSRFEMVYPPRIQRDYLDFLRGGSEASAVLAAYPTDYVMMPTDSVASRFMAAHTGWRLLYRDPVAALFARADSPAAHIAGIPVLRDKAPPSLFP